MNLKKLLTTVLVMLLSMAIIPAFSGSGSEPDIKALQRIIRSHLEVATLPPVRCNVLYRTAWLRFSIQPNGDITDVELKQSSMNPAFDSAVLNAIRQSSPLPPSVSGKDEKRNRVELITLNFPDMHYLKRSTPITGAGNRMMANVNSACSISKIDF